MSAIAHWQNLNEDRQGKIKGSGFWHGRAWLFGYDGVRAEWCIGRKSSNFVATVEWLDGESNRDLQFVFGLPWLFTIYFTICGFFGKMFDEPWKKGPRRAGVNYHDNALHLYFGGKSHEWNSKDPWWEQGITLTMPWDYRWFSTEVLEHKSNLPYLADVVWSESAKNRRKWDEERDERTNREEMASETYDYTYVLKNGENQKRKASVFVDRMTWRMRWYPLLPFKKSKTCINVKFDAEVGEETGSWKGGCLGCGYEMNHGETPLQTLRRMESERKF